MTPLEDATTICASSDVNFFCGINSPLWERVEAEEQGAVGVDGDVGSQDADDVQGKSGLHHV